MFRRANPALVLLLAACSEGASDTPPVAPPAQTDAISCALAGSAQFSPVCSLEQSIAQGQRLLVVRHPDGAFRRFSVSADGQGLSEADGAVEAGAAPNGKMLDVRVGEDRYRLPYPLERP